MIDADVLAKVREIVAESGPLDETPADNQPLFYIAAQVTHDQARAKGSYGLDSLDRVEVMMAVEQEFDLDIPEEVGAELDTVGQIAAYVQLRRDAAANAG